MMDTPSVKPCAVASAAFLSNGVAAISTTSFTRVAKASRKPVVTSVPCRAIPLARVAGYERVQAEGTEKRTGGGDFTRIVLICGFETFNLATYKAAAEGVKGKGIDVVVMTDKDLERRDESVQRALSNADVVFCSLIFDYDQVEWLRGLLPEGGVVFVFESALELMGETRVGSFKMKTGGGGGGMPTAVQAVLRKLGLMGREEDKLAGYLSLLKTAPKLLKFVPGGMARDLRHWLSVYAFWNAGGTDNVVAMLEYIRGEILERGEWEKKDVVQIPNVGLVHPARPGFFFEHPAEYVQWYVTKYPERKAWSRVGVLLYRKHVVSNLAYIPQLIQYFEEAELIPLPVFITGVEAHIIVRDYFTSVFKEKARERGERLYGSYRRGKTATVDAVVSTIG